MVSCVSLSPVMKSRTDSEMSKTERGFFSLLILGKRKKKKSHPGNSEFRRIQMEKYLESSVWPWRGRQTVQGKVSPQEKITLKFSLK